MDVPCSPGTPQEAGITVKFEKRWLRLDKITTSCRNGRHESEEDEERRREEEQGTYFPVYPNLPEG